jgi:hypothetical protein
MASDTMEIEPIREPEQPQNDEQRQNDEQQNDEQQNDEPRNDDETTALVTTNPEPKTKKMKKVKKRRPARMQVDPATFKAPLPEASGTIYNVWYNKWSGGDRDVPDQFAAPNRCNISRDSGFTRGDSVTGSYFCLFFARGICTQGRECEYLHRLPGLHDLFNPNVDCFGRDKFSDYRDDMGGVGSFMRQNRTLYVGRIHVTDDIEEVVARHFVEWGQVDRIRVLDNRGVAFVTYSNLANSEFAKEAMAHQALDHEETLNVRWATIDPNPAAQKREARKIEEQAAAAIRKALPPEYVAELEGKDPEARKRRKLDNFGLDGYEPSDDVWFAKEKAEWVAQQRGLPGVSGEGMSDEQLLMESIEQEQQQIEEQDSIFSGSTLAALRNRHNTAATSSSTTKKVTAKKATAASAGPLVAYGSDSD